jgi:hypothetical protein
MFQHVMRSEGLRGAKLAGWLFAFLVTQWPLFCFGLALVVARHCMLHIASSSFQ